MNAPLSAESVHCQLCGRKLAGPYKRIHHSKWPPELSLRICLDCYRDKPRCRVCDLPVAAETPNRICPTCAGLLSTCLACGEVVTGGYVEVDGVGPYCMSCFHSRPPCDICSAPLTDEKWQLSDGRISCGRCHATAIDTSAEAAALYDGLKQVMGDLLGLRLNIPTGLALVDRNQLTEIIRRQTDGQEAADPERTLGIYTRRGTRRSIYLQTGLPRLLALQIAAHEHAHAWQGENCPLLKDDLVREGFAEWAAYRVLGHYGLRRRQERMQMRPDLYGQGLNWALQVEASQGIPGVVEACRAAR